MDPHKSKRYKNVCTVKPKTKMNHKSMIWERVPKITYCGKDKLELAVYDAAVNYNDGKVEIFIKLNITPGHYTTVLCYILNKCRIFSAKYKGKGQYKKSN